MSTYDKLLYMIESIDDRKEINELKKEIDSKYFKPSKNSFKTRDEDEKQLPDKVKEKIKDLIYVCRTTDDYKEYRKSFNTLCELTGLSSRKIIASGSSSSYTADNGYIYLYNNKNKESRKSFTLPQGTKLYHTSNIPNLTELKPTFRAGKINSSVIDKKRNQDSLYPTKRVYFFIDNPGSRTTTNNEQKYIARDGEYVYQYTGPLANIKYDTEGGNKKSVFIETDKPVPVKDVTNQFRKADLKKESVELLFLESVESFVNNSITYNDFKYILDVLL